MMNSDAEKYLEKPEKWFSRMCKQLTVNALKGIEQKRFLIIACFNLQL